MSRVFKIAMFITSFLPLWITVVFIDSMSLIKGETNKYTEVIGLIVIFIAVIGSITAIIFAMNNVKETEYKPYRIKKAVQEKGITSEFLLSYILPLFAFDFTLWEKVVQFLIYFCILAFLCIRNNNVYANLIFECRKYKFYSCEIEWVPEPSTTPISTIIISKSNLCANCGNTVSIAPLNKPFYLMEGSKE